WVREVPLLGRRPYQGIQSTIKYTLPGRGLPWEGADRDPNSAPAPPTQPQTCTITRVRATRTPRASASNSLHTDPLTLTGLRWADPAHDRAQVPSRLPRG